MLNEAAGDSLIVRAAVPLYTHGPVATTIQLGSRLGREQNTRKEGRIAVILPGAHRVGSFNFLDQ
jgi:hypothetical protein